MSEQEPPIDEVGSGPRVFISYRREDTGDLARRLSIELRADLGSTNVFRDEDDLIVGERWQTALAEHIAASDAAMFLVGGNWRGLREDATSRIDDDDDPVRREVQQALERHDSSLPLPFLVDIVDPPGDLPDEVTPLFEDHHYVAVSRESLESGSSTDYQGVLVGVWNALRARVPRGVIILGEPSAMASLDELVKKLKESGQAEARHLSRFASGAYVVSVREGRRLTREWSDVFVIADAEEPSEELKSRVAALFAIPGVKVSLVGAGAAALGLFAGQALGAGSGASPTVVSSASELVMGGQQTGLAASLQSGWSNAAIGAKIATVAAAAVVTVGGVYAASELFNNDAPQFAASSQLAPVEADYPLGTPEPVTVSLDPVEPVSEEEALEYFQGFEGGSAERRNATVTYGDSRVDLGDIVVPVTYPAGLLEANVGEFLIAGGDSGQEVPFIESGVGATITCLDRDTREPAGGWLYTGDPGLLVLDLLFESDGNSVVDIGMDVSFEGPVEVMWFSEYLEEVDINAPEYDDNCTPIDRLEMVWTIEGDASG